MKSFSVLLLFSHLLLLGCGNSSNKRKADNLGDNYIKKNDCLERQKHFLLWYLNNYENINNKSHVIKYQKEAVLSMGDSLEYASSTNYYQFSEDNMEKYLTKIRNTGYFSNEFINTKRASMIVRGEELNRANQDDGPVEGFDSDEIFHTQEMYLPEYIDSLRIDIDNSNRYILPITKKYRWIIYTKKLENFCLIDSIVNKQD